MADKYYTLLTDYGLDEIMKAVQEKAKVNITEFAVGDGGGFKCTPQAGAQTLENEVWRGPVSACYISEESKNTLIVESVVPYNAGGFTVREMGIFDDKGGMIAICNAPDTQKVKFSDGVVHELSLSMELELENAGSVYLEVDPNVISATKKDLEKMQEALDAQCRQVEEHTDKKIADLVGGAPDTLNSLGKIAQAMSDNESAVEALNEAVGKKASAVEFDSHVRDNTAHITPEERNAWTRKVDLSMLASYLPLAGGIMCGDIITARMAPAANKRYAIGESTKRYSGVWAVKINTNIVSSPQDADFLLLESQKGSVQICPDVSDYINVIIENIDDGNGNINGALYAMGGYYPEHKENWLGTFDHPWDNVFASKINSKPIPACSISGTTLYINF